MNIFDVLSQGKGKLNEENMTAMLGFLLNPQQSHGLKDLFLGRFLKVVDKHCCSDLSQHMSSRCKVDITFESPYEYQGRIRYIDIDLKLFVDGQEVARILIENKIRASSANQIQFYEEYKGVCEDLIDDSLEGVETIMVFLTPNVESVMLSEEYNKLLEEDMMTNHRKCWMHWDKNDSEEAVEDILTGIILDENNMVINPISEYVRHTIKAFVRFIGAMKPIHRLTNRAIPLDGDEVAKSFDFIIEDERYKLEAYETSAIKVFRESDENYVSAKPMLRKIIEVYNYDIDLYRTNGKKKTTRQLGRDVIKEIEK